MAGPTRSIRRAQAAAWEEVQPSLALLRHRQRQVTDTPGELSKHSQWQAKRPWSRQVVDETVWALARAGFLATPEQRNVLQSARDWYACGPDASDEDMDTTEDKLVDAIKAWLTSLDSEDDEEPLLPVDSVPSPIH